jgi:hypothetical protein
LQPQPPTNKKTQAEEKLSEKHKARRLLKKIIGSQKSKKEERKRNLKMLQQDKLVRETDPNWKPEVSSACAKSGSGLLDFRDRHENKQLLIE